MEHKSHRRRLFPQHQLPPSCTSWDTSQLYLTGEITLEALLKHPLLPGDFNEDKQLGVDDVDALAAVLRNPTADTFFDVNADMQVDRTDLDIWVHDLRQTYFGDANLDGQFDSDDLVSVLASGEYEDDDVGNSGWADGDWDADAEFTSADLIIALADGGYETGPRPAAVPEPSAFLVLALGLGSLMLCRKPVAWRRSF